MIKNQKEMEELLIKYDKDLNKKHHLIQAIKKYCMKTHMTIEEYEELIKMVGKENEV